MKKLEAIAWVRVSSPAQWNNGDHIVQQKKIEAWCRENNILDRGHYAAQYRKYEMPWDNRDMRLVMVDIDTYAELGIQPDMVVAVSIDRYGTCRYYPKCAAAIFQ